MASQPEVYNLTMNRLRHLYRASQVGEMDRLAIESFGIPGYELMCRAGEAAFRRLRARWPEASGLTIFCGAGNNGGDGYVIARLAQDVGLSVQVISLKSPLSLSGDAARAAADWLDRGEVSGDIDQPVLGDVIVDALLGTGLDRAPEGVWAQAIERINCADRPVVAIDLPSGLAADTGMPLGVCVKADLTVSFIGNKRGLWTGQAGRWCGDRHFDALETPDELIERIPPDARLLIDDDLRQAFSSRPADTHKGQLGHVLVVGGDLGMAGAVLLAGRAALASGSGLVSLATRPEHAVMAPVFQPELMAHGVTAAEQLQSLTDRASVLALGPGLGQSDWSKTLWNTAVASEVPMVIDADGLNLLAGWSGASGPWVLTPHPGEAARLLDCSTVEIQRDRFAAARKLAARFGAVVVLKGHGSLIATPDGRMAVCGHGSPAMATAGMGDALTGIIASLLGQGMGFFEAACQGVLLHAVAGDRAAQGRRQILASDLIAQLPEVMPS